MQISKFEPFGPFKVPVHGVMIDKSLEGKFWEQVEHELLGLSEAVGCYILQFGRRKESCLGMSA
jgi:hypothetical protein